MAERRRWRVFALIGTILVCVVVALLVRAKVGKKDPQDRALAAADKQRAGGDGAGALRTLLDCAGREPDACRCSDAAMELAVDLGRYEDAQNAEMRGVFCKSPRHIAGRAEVEVGLGRTADGAADASRALTMQADEPHAWFAKAWALSASGFSPEALSAAERAVKYGRGLPALLLLGTLRAGGGDPAGARDAVEQAARIDPANPRVAYDVGVLEQSAGHYRQAREAYLHALALDPKLADARYNLAVLTHSVGADDEARHHIDALAIIAPGDPRIPALRVALLRK
jgi:tetratricopeptide (TPR) repeat protein